MRFRVFVKIPKNPYVYVITIIKNPPHLDGVKKSLCRKADFYQGYWKVLIMNRKKIKITTTIDLELSEIFKSSMNEHGKGYQDALEEGILSILREISEPNFINNRLNELDQERDQLLILKAKSKNID